MSLFISHWYSVCSRWSYEHGHLRYFSWKEGNWLSHTELTVLHLVAEIHVPGRAPVKHCNDVYPHFMTDGELCDWILVEQTPELHAFENSGHVNNEPVITEWHPILPNLQDAQYVHYLIQGQCLIRQFSLFFTRTALGDGTQRKINQYFSLPWVGVHAF